MAVKHHFATNIQSRKDVFSLDLGQTKTWIGKAKGKASVKKFFSYAEALVWDSCKTLVRLS